MAKKKKEPRESENEKVLDFESAKDMTVGQVVRKQEEIKLGIESDDSILDRYIKQHRKDIDANKFETMVDQPALDDEILDSIPVVGSGLEETVVAGEALAIHKVDRATPLLEDVDEDEDFESEEDEERLAKLKRIVWSILGIFFVIALAGVYLWLHPTSSNKDTASSTSSSTKQTSTTSSSASETAEFDKVYATFFTDSSLTKLKNSEFGKLATLKAALDKMDTKSDAYKAAKAKYDNLEKAIKAIQALNKQFDKDAIVNGELDTTATVKADATLTATTTGLQSVDTLLTSAINFARSQQTSASTSVASSTEPAASTSETPTPTASDTAPEATTASASQTTDASLYGIAVPAGVTLQRDLSRVPYNHSAIDDASNEAWNFNPGILENIISISQQRGYITGNHYILEKVNIINGNGYYNLFKPDGTYLFSINCKTGYFVGNGAGHADALDY